MVNSKTLIIFIISCLLSGLSYGQDVTDLKREFNNIKKNPEYIYGQSSGENEEKCFEIAYDEFLAKIKEYVSENEELKNASAVILQNMQKSAKKISFERYLNCKVVCVYINKNDIKVVSTSDIIETTKGNIPIIVNNVNESKSETNTDIVPGITSSVEASMHAVENNEVTEETPLATEKTTINVDSSKESEILNEIANLCEFPKIVEFLNNRKLSAHDIVFKATMQYGNVVNSYWLIFDRNKKLLAIQSKDKTMDLLSNKSTNSQEYSNSPKVWLQIY